VGDAIIAASTLPRIRPSRPACGREDRGPKAPAASEAYPGDPRLPCALQYGGRRLASQMRPPSLEGHRRLRCRAYQREDVRASEHDRETGSARNHGGNRRLAPTADRAPGDDRFGIPLARMRAWATWRCGRLPNQWVAPIGIEPPAYGARSMRRTIVARIFGQTGAHRPVRFALGLAKLGGAVR
jgi:hypothetical protein